MPTVDTAYLNVINKVVGLSETQKLDAEIAAIASHSQDADKKIREFAQGQDVSARASRTLGTEVNQTSRSFGFAKVALVALAGAVTAVGLAMIGAFRDGLKEVAESEDAFGRMESAANLAGLSVDALAKAAEDLSADKLLDATDAMRTFADLASKGFGEDQIVQLGVALKDISASVGGNIRDNFNKLSDALVTGRVRSAELQRMLPGLTAELERTGLSAKDFGNESKQAEIQQALFNAVMERGQEVLGASADKLQTVTGQTQAVTQEIADLKEIFATAIIEGFSDGTGKVHDFAGELARLEPAVHTLGGAIGDLASSLLVGLAQAFNSVRGFVSIAHRQWLELANVANILAQAVLKFAIEAVSSLAKIPGVGKLLQGTLDSLANSYSALMVDAVKLKIEIADESAHFDALAIQSGILSGELIDVTKLFSGMGTETDKAATGFDRLTGAFDENSAAAKKAAAEAKKLAEEQERAFQKVLDSGGKALILVQQFAPPQPMFDLNNIDAAIIALEKAAQAEMDLAKAATLAAIAQDQWNAKMDEAQASFDQWQNFFSTMSQQIPGIGGQIMGFADQFMQTGINLVKNGASTTQAYAGAIGSVLSGIGAQVEGLGGTFLRVGGAIAQGFATGGPWGAVIAGLAAVASELMSLFSHDWGEDVERTLNNFLPGLQLSSDLLDQIAKKAEEAGDAMVGVFLSLPDIIDEVGASAAGLAEELRNGFSLLETGAITSAQLIDVLNQSFDDLATASMDSMGRISPAMKQIIALTQAWGLEVEAVTNFINSSLTNAANGLNAIVGAGLNSAADVNRASRIFAATMSDLLAQGFSFDQAMQLLQPSFDQIKQAMKDMGLEGTAAFKAIVKEMRFLERNDAVINGLQGVIDMLVNLDNAGLLNKSTFKDLERTAADMFKKFTDDGRISNREMRAMAPTLALLEQLAAEYGLTLDASTQEMIDLARERGFLDQAKQAETLQDAIGRLVDEIRAFIAELRGIPSQIGTTVTTTYATAGTPPGSGGSTGGGKSMTYSASSSGFSTQRSGSTTQTQTRTRTLQPIQLQIGSRQIAEVMLEVSEDGTLNSLRSA